MWLGSYSLCKNHTVYGAKYCLAPKVDVFFPGLVCVNVLSLYDDFSQLFVHHSRLAMMEATVDSCCLEIAIETNDERIV